MMYLLRNVLSRIVCRESVSRQSKLLQWSLFGNIRISRSRNERRDRMTKKKKRDGFFKDLFEEIAGTVIVEVLIFIPRIIIRAISKIW